MKAAQLSLALLVLMTSESGLACDYSHARYVYSSDDSVSARFEKLPPHTDLVSDVAMAIERPGKPAFWFVFDAGASVTSRMSETTSVGRDAWRIGATKHRSLTSLPFYGWTSNYVLVNSPPQASGVAPDILFVPDLDEALRHLPDAQFNLGQGFFKKESCK